MFLLALLPSHLGTGLVEPATLSPNLFLGSGQGCNTTCLPQGFPLHYIAGWVRHSLLQGKGGTQKLYKSQPQDIGVGMVTEFPLTSLPQAMQRLGSWNGQSRQAQACPAPKY